MSNALTFAKVSDNRIDYWNVLRTGDYGDDCANGRAYADELASVIRDEGNPGLLHHVVEAIAREGQFGHGVEIGFLHRLAESTISQPRDLHRKLCGTTIQCS